MIPSRQESYLKCGKKALDMCRVGCAAALQGWAIISGKLSEG
jgi:hypothetical protein